MIGILAMANNTPYHLVFVSIQFIRSIISHSKYSNHSSYCNDVCFCEGIEGICSVFKNSI